MNDKPTIIVLGFDVTYENGKAVEWVNYAPAHMANYAQNRERVEFMNPERMKLRTDDENGAKKADFMRYRWAQIERAYKAWKDGHEIPVDGTPLAAWSGLNKAQADEFRKLGINSVELIAGMNDAIMERVRLPGVRDIRAQAQAFLDAKGSSETAERLSDLERKNEALAEQLEAAMALLAEKAEPKRGPGRPRKAEAEAHA